MRWCKLPFLKIDSSSARNTTGLASLYLMQKVGLTELCVCGGLEGKPLHSANSILVSASMSGRALRTTEVQEPETNTDYSTVPLYVCTVLYGLWKIKRNSISLETIWDDRAMRVKSTIRVMETTWGKPGTPSLATLLQRRSH
jgi:hypothetical protein